MFCLFFKVAFAPAKQTLNLFKINQSTKMSLPPKMSRPPKMSMVVRVRFQFKKLERSTKQNGGSKRDKKRLSNQERKWFFYFFVFTIFLFCCGCRKSNIIIKFKYNLSGYCLSPFTGWNKNEGNNFCFILFLQGDVVVLVVVTKWECEIAFAHNSEIFSKEITS